MMTKDSMKGFLFGALLMMIPPAFAAQPAPVDLSETAASEPVDTPYFRLSYSDVEEAIAQALSDRGAGAKVTTNLVRQGEQYLFSYAQPINIEIRGLRFDQKTNRFSANLIALSEGKVVSARAVSGRFDEMVEIPVLKRSLRAGDVIQSEDVELRDYAKGRMREDTVTDIASLVGQSPERTISSGRPVRVQELGQPHMVHKNDLIKMYYTQGSLSLSATGQALTDGVKGSVISVRNMESKKIIQATVKDANSVVIAGDELQANDMLSQLVGKGGVYEN